MASGRRFGKTLAACYEAACCALFKDGSVTWWIAPTYSTAMKGWRTLDEMLPEEIIESKQLTERHITFRNGSHIWIKSADNPDGLRGEGLDLAIFDEAAFIHEDAWTAAIRPALADKQGAAVLISTPLGRNWFWRAYLRGQGEDSEWASWSFKTEDNPYIPAGEIEAAQRDMPERIFRQEFMAEFLEDAGAVFRKVAEAATATRQESADGCRMGVDWGKMADFSCITVLDRSGQMIAWDRFNQIDYTVQTQRLKAMADRYHPSLIVAEANAMGEPIIEQLRRDNLPVQAFTTTAASKAEMIEGLALAFEKGEIKILPEPVLVNELQAFEMTRLPGGGIRYAAPEGLHDDSVISLALAWWGTSRALTGSLMA